MLKVFKNIESCIGNTPIIELKHSLVPHEKKLLLKLEYFNPSFSIKDRTGLGLIKAGLKQGKLKPGGTVIESTSGNLGKSLAMLGAALGFKVILVVDPKISLATLNLFKAYGATVIMVEKSESKADYQKSRLEKVKQLLKQMPDAY